MTAKERQIARKERRLRRLNEQFWSGRQQVTPVADVSATVSKYHGPLGAVGAALKNAAA